MSKSYDTAIIKAHVANGDMPMKHDWTSTIRWMLGKLVIPIRSIN